MKPTTSYGITALGVVILVVGIVLIALGHHTSAYAAIAVGAIVIIAGLVTLFAFKPKAQ